MKWLGFIIMMGTLGYFLHMNGPLTVFIDIPSLLFILLSVIASNLIFLGSNIKQAKLDDITSISSRSAILAGVLCCLIGLIASLQNLSDPSSIGPAMALTYLPILYSIIIVFFCFVMTKDYKNLNLNYLIAPFFVIGFSQIIFFSRMIQS
jgi:flagellar motor component MotA